MTGLNVAAPGDDNPGAIVDHKPQPADPITLACPNCNETAGLILIERAMIERGIDAALDVGATDPYIETDDLDDATVLTVPVPEVVGVRCEHCRWGYKGHKPLDRLVRQR